ncbi:response regulator [Candidatus Bipolaricaulota bacterium]|nr:response regulator [Candidatus Bipolaricaulota bacterium]MCK4598638.1 response regulator [Candidatus Bipolaricaulota bacterium]
MLNPEKIKVLVVEDNPNDVTIIKRAMRKSEVKCELSFARDGEEALNFLYRQGEFEDAPRPDLILLDLRLPKIDGLEVLAKIKDDNRLRRIPVIVLTISTSQEDMVKAYDSGAASYMTKPVDSKDFERLIQTVQDYWRVAKTPPE